MKRTTLDLWVGFFAAIGLAALMFLAFKVGNLSTARVGPTYLLSAKFDDIGGLKVRAPVKSAGVVVGRVADVHFDGETFKAVVTLQMDGRYAFPKDTIAAIRTSGLLGEQYVGLLVGGDTDNLKAGDTVKRTDDAVVLERLIGQFMFNKAAEEPGKK